MSEFDFATNIGDLLSLVLRNCAYRVDPDRSNEHAGALVSIIKIEPSGEVCVRVLDSDQTFSISPRFLRRADEA